MSAVQHHPLWPCRWTVERHRARAEAHRAWATEARELVASGKSMMPERLLDMAKAKDYLAEREDRAAAEHEEAE